MLIFGFFRRGRKKPPPIIGATCAFDVRIYKNVDGLLVLTSCRKWNKKFFQIFDFCSALSSLLVDFFTKIMNRNAIEFEKFSRIRSCAGEVFFVYNGET
jgi:hypothetical protein